MSDHWTYRRRLKKLGHLSLGGVKSLNHLEDFASDVRAKAAEKERRLYTELVIEFDSTESTLTAYLLRPETEKDVRMKKESDLYSACRRLDEAQKEVAKLREDLGSDPKPISFGGFPNV